MDFRGTLLVKLSKNERKKFKAKRWHKLLKN